MAYNKAAYLASKKYKEKSIKRIPLDVQVELYQELRSAAEMKSESVNGYIKTAIRQRLERDGAEDRERTET